MRISVIEGRALDAEMMSRWSALQQADPALASPYLCPEFTSAVASVRDDVYVGVLTQRGEVIGFFPFQRGAMGIGKPVGGALSDCQGIIMEEGHPLSPMRLLRDCGLRAWDFDHLIASQTLFEACHRAQAESPVINLTTDCRAYLADRRAGGSRIVEKMGRSRCKLEREVGPIRFEAHVDDAGVLDQLIRWKSEQYRRTGLVDVFSFDWSVQLIRRIHAIRRADFAGMLSVLYAGGEMVAAHMGMRSRHVWHWWFPWYDMRFAKYSPGILLLLDMVGTGPSLGIGQIDLGKGNEPYKCRLMNGAVPLAEGSVARSTVVATVRRVRDRLVASLRAMPLPQWSRKPGRWVRRMARRRRYQ